MPNENRALWIIVITICGLAIVFAIASIFVADFRENGAFIVGTILGALASLAGIIVGTEAAKRYTSSSKEE